MSDLAKAVLEAHGGIERFKQFKTVSVDIVSGGGLWPLKGLIQDATPRKMVAALHEEYASVSPFGQPDWRTSFHADRVAIETTEGEVVKEARNPRSLFDGHVMNTPWNPLHRAYFNGYAMWTYLLSPFFLALPGFESEEIATIEENGEQWRGLRVRFPSYIASHCEVQDFYFGPDLLLRRHDYQVDVAGSFPAAQYVDGYVDVQGFRMPTRRRAYLRGPDGKAVHDMLFVSIDLSGYSFA